MVDDNWIRIGDDQPVVSNNNVQVTGKRLPRRAFSVLMI